MLVIHTLVPFFWSDHTCFFAFLLFEFCPLVFILCYISRNILSFQPRESVIARHCLWPLFFLLKTSDIFYFHDYDEKPILDCVRKIYMKFPQIPVPQHLGDDEDMQKISEALGAAKIRVDGCSSFLKAAIK